MSDNINARPFGNNLFYLISLVLIAYFLWCAFVPAHSWPSPSVAYMQMLFDAGMIVGLVGSRVNRNFDSVGSHLLFWVALACGIGLLIIRLTSSPAWYSGHIVNTLS